MELPTKILEKIAFNTRLKIEEHMFIVMDKISHVEHLSQPLQTNIKQFKLDVTFSTGYNGIFNVTNSNIRFCFPVSINDADYSVISIPSGTCELESLNDDNKRLLIKDS